MPRSRSNVSNVQWEDLETTVEAVLKLHLSLEYRRFVVAFTLSQMGVAWQFDGVQYRELQQVIAQQVQAIQLLFSKPERLLSLLPASATLHKGRSREQNLRLRQLQQRALSALHLHRTEALAALDAGVIERADTMEEGLNPVFVAKGVWDS